MDHDLAYASMIYLALFRLAIIAVGGLSIALGYKLFAKGLYPEPSGKDGASFQAELGGTKLSLKNTAPGTFFALFGVILIGMMLLNAPAEVDYSKITPREAAQSYQRAEPAQTPIESIRMRGGDDNRKMAAEFHRIAWEESDAKSYKRAVSFCRIALYLEPDNASMTDSLATMLFEARQYEEALKYKEKAAAMDVKYKEDIQKFRDAVK